MSTPDSRGLRDSRHRCTAERLTPSAWRHRVAGVMLGAKLGVFRSDSFDCKSVRDREVGLAIHFAGQGVEHEPRRSQQLRAPARSAVKFALLGQMLSDLAITSWRIIHLYQKMRHSDPVVTGQAFATWKGGAPTFWTIPPRHRRRSTILRTSGSRLRGRMDHAKTNEAGDPGFGR